MLGVSIFQINASVGDFRTNAEKLQEASLRAREEGAGLLVAPLGALTGYPVEGFSRRAEFLLRQKEAFTTLVPKLAVPALFGMTPGLVLVENGTNRLVVPGEVVEIAGTRFGILSQIDSLPDSVCDMKLRRAEAVLVVAADPFKRGRPEARLNLVSQVARKLALPILFVNLAGGADVWVFDGASFVVNRDGACTARLAHSAEDFKTVDLVGTKALDAPPADELGDLYDALVLALGDYVHKNGFKTVQLGLSGGIDSALVATICADALGPENVHALMMPTRYTTDLSLTEAEKLAKNLGIHYTIRPIGALFDAYRKELSEDFAGTTWDATEENLQARIRGNLLMAYANKFGRLVIATSNKSESAAGYATLYGDTTGAFEAISDVYKTDVWALARYRNVRAGRELIPESIISRAPSAELREGQKDSQSLPEYPVLDAVLRLYVDRGKSVSEIVKAGFDRALVECIVRMTHRAEFKRRQCPIGARVSDVAFSGPVWNYPMTVKLEK